ncbi:MAG: hypothetical protein HQ567_15330 [Candidatus Nealsonbacteria bacterium]|nr:hypothetical protein [Candidatus Nealsonbacteria bacterium]
MMSEAMIRSVARTEPSQAIPQVEASQAVSGLVPFAKVRHLLTNAPPPRRPNRTYPITPADPAVLRELQELTPSNTELIELAKRFPAPQEWYDE